MISVTLPEGMPSISWAVQWHFLAMFYKFVLAPNMSSPLSSGSEALQLSALAQGTACGLHLFRYNCHHHHLILKVPLSF